MADGTDNYAEKVGDTQQKQNTHEFDKVFRNAIE